MENFDFAGFVMSISAFVLGITVHEWAHAASADALGDTTPRSQGRVTLWPLAHLDPVGTALMIISTITGFGFGWGRPVLVDPRQFRIDPRIADSLVAAAGPFSNLVIAALFAGLYHLHVFPPGDAFEAFTLRIILVNVGLCVFNLIPVYPLDGSHLLANALPRPMAEAYLDFSQRFGIFIFVALVLTGVTRLLMVPAVVAVIQLLNVPIY
jgi:Zn-dependent protease